MRPNSSDAWLLQAIYNGNGSASDALGAADYLNRTIPTQDEWEHAGVVLGERGLILAGDPFPTVTSAGKEITKANTAGLGRFDRLLKAIEKAEVTAQAVSMPSEAQMAEAYEAYSREIRKLIKKSIHGRGGE